MREHLSHFYIAGLTYYDYVLCAKKIQIGTLLELKLELDNKYDPRAIAIFYKDHKIGFVPRAENRILYKLLITGHPIFETRILTIDKSMHPEKAVQVIIHIIANSNKEIKEL